MKQVYPKFEDETIDEQRAAQRYNPATVAIYKGVRFTLDAGSNDDISCFTNADQLLVTSVNTSLGYVGLQVFHLTGDYAGQEDGSIFLQNDSEIREILGRKGLDYSARTIAKTLEQYVQ